MHHTLLMTADSLQSMRNTLGKQATDAVTQHPAGTA
jgi:hypothetical protein